jgi:membrane-bound lytic murein transglycosylase B
LTLAIAGLLAAPPAVKAQEIFSRLAGQLQDIGFEPARLKKLFNHPQLKFEARVLARMLSARESKLNYRQFLSKSNLKAAKGFLRRHRAYFAKARSRYGVRAEVVAAIILVESRLGKYTGKYRVFNVLASQAMLHSPQGRRQLAGYWPRRRKKELDQPKNRIRFERRSHWALEELAGLMHLAQRDRASPFAYKGSPAGAMGLGQFMPTSVLIWGQDANADGRVNLDHPGDAIFSVAHYLQDHGWRKGLRPKDQTEVILTYNKSTPYAQTVLELARRLKGPQKSRNQ